MVFVKFKDWLKAINTKGGLSFSDLTHFVQNRRSNAQKVDQGGLSLVELTNFVKNCNLIRLRFEKGLFGTWRMFRVPDLRLEGWGHV